MTGAAAVQMSVAAEAATIQTRRPLSLSVVCFINNILAAYNAILQPAIYNTDT